MVGMENGRNMNRVKLFITILVLALVYGCAAQNGIVKYGKISNQDITIVAEDGSFLLKAGESFEPPFQSKTSSSRELHNSALDITGLYDVALEKLGAKKVKVQVGAPDGEITKEYYGVLLFSKIYDDGYGPGTRSYLINIPELYLEAANGGKISVITELYNRKKNRGNAKSWVLWISDLPFEA